MKKLKCRKITLMMAVLIILMLCLPLASCSRKENKEPEIPAVHIEMSDEINLSDGVIKFRIVNATDKDYHVLGPLGKDMLMEFVDNEKNIYAYSANSNEYYDKKLEEQCKEYNGRYYFTVEAGKTAEYSLETEWFMGIYAGKYKMSVLITDDVTDGIFENCLEYDFVLV